ncbi:hypothetical protein H4R26_000791 [Coemansia thaxteri]|uniref:Mid2 domain-containing protein n=1 Tax=Coemansia thaxteri TaxID=2663907 RepID=A0A9W8BH08_9FUNG|nr:hypothetical protein H4R26_000791 [Coemansia thaxteri]KAJ2485008.1 hypothetical protein EV174_002018 [Coemansia sp. RSA 2320]
MKTPVAHLAPALLLGLLLAASPTGVLAQAGGEQSSSGSPSVTPPASSTLPASTTPVVSPTSVTPVSSATPPPATTTPSVTPPSTTPPVSSTPTPHSSTPVPQSSTPNTDDGGDVTVTSVVTRTTFSSLPTSATSTPLTTPTSATASATRSHTGKDGSSTDELPATSTSGSEPTTSSGGGDSKQPDKNTNSLSSGAIAGIAVGALILVAGGILGFLFWRRHKQKTQYAQKIDYAEFPEFNPSTSNNGLTSHHQPAATIGQHMPYYSDKSNVGAPGSATAAGGGPVGPGASGSGVNGATPHAFGGHPVSDPSLLRELDEA